MLNRADKGFSLGGEFSSLMIFFFIALTLFSIMFDGQPVKYLALLKTFTVLNIYAYAQAGEMQCALGIKAGDEAGQESYTLK